jgi:hypothetical protein
MNFLPNDPVPPVTNIVFPVKLYICFPLSLII